MSVALGIVIPQTFIVKFCQTTVSKTILHIQLTQKTHYLTEHDIIFTHNNNNNNNHFFHNVGHKCKLIHSQSHNWTHIHMNMNMDNFPGIKDCYQPAKDTQSLAGSLEVTETFNFVGKYTGTS